MKTLQQKYEKVCTEYQVRASLGQTPRKYVFDVTSVGQRSSPWQCNSVKVEVKFHLESEICFVCAQVILLRLMQTTVEQGIGGVFKKIWGRLWYSVLMRRHGPILLHF